MSWFLLEAPRESMFHLSLSAWWPWPAMAVPGCGHPSLICAPTFSLCLLMRTAVTGLEPTLLQCDHVLWHLQKPYFQTRLNSQALGGHEF